MDDLFGWLQGEKISAKKIQETLQKKLNSYPLSKEINRCPSCEEQIVYVVNELCLVCQKCGRVIECDDNEYFKEENRVRIFTATNFHLKSVLRKWKINEMFSSSEVDFLGNVIAQFPPFEVNRWRTFSKYRQNLFLYFFRLKREGSSNHISHFVPIEFGCHF